MTQAATQAGRISDAAVERATGRTWAAWLALLDEAGEVTGAQGGTPAGMPAVQAAGAGSGGGQECVPPADG